MAEVITKGLREMVRAEGAKSLWRGLSPTLWRDIPFSAVYWHFYETFKSSIIAAYPPKTSGNDFKVALVAGAGAGSIAAVVTTPFDVAKTRRQMEMSGVTGIQLQIYYPMTQILFFSIQQKKHVFCQ